MTGIEKLTPELIQKLMNKHLDSLPYAGGYPSDWRETLAVFLFERLAALSSLPVQGLSIDEAGVIAVKIAEGLSPVLTAQEQSLFIAGFQECVKWQAQQQGTLQWVSEKPVFERDCIVLIKQQFRGEWEYQSWLIKLITDPDVGCYWGWFTIDGEEYGDIADLTSEWYMVIPLDEAAPKKEEENQDEGGIFGQSKIL